MVTIRYVRDDDWDTIHEALKRAFKVARRKKDLVDRYDYCDGPRMVDAIVKDKLVDAIIVNETYLVCYTVNEVWYSGDKLLAENLVLKINKLKQDFSCVVEALEIIAKVNGCVGICSGTAFSSNNKVVADKYIANGFKLSGYELYKGI